MQRFFSSLPSLESFSRSLNTLPQGDTCQHCLKNDQWVSHGYVYKRGASDSNEVTGKRILCSARYGKTGCGHTRRLYLDRCIPHCHYPLNVVVAFIWQLIRGLSVENAYLKAVNPSGMDARHAWRWMNRLNLQLGYFRSTLKFAFKTSINAFSRQSRRRQILLPTLVSLLSRPEKSCSIQSILQSPLF